MMQAGQLQYSVLAFRVSIFPILNAPASCYPAPVHLAMRSSLHCLCVAAGLNHLTVNRQPRA